MKATQLWYEHNLLKNKCIIAIERLMQYNDEITLRHPIGIANDPDIEITGIKFKSPEILIFTRSFGFLHNWCFPANDSFLELKDYISIINQLEQHFIEPG